MKIIRYIAALCIFAAVPALALAQGATWTGAYVGGQVGVNNSSSDNFSTENAFDLGVLGGYNFQLSDHFALGGDAFYEWNQNKTHTAGVQSGELGTYVYGVDALFGFPLGDTGTWMPYLKLGYGWGQFRGNASGGAPSLHAIRYGGGIEWRVTEMFGISFQYIYQKFNSDADHWLNQNFTAGFNFHFQ